MIGFTTEIMKKFIILLLFMALSIYSTRACTAFVLKKSNKNILAKNLDWTTGQGFVIVNMPNIHRTALPFNNRIPLEWKSQYSSITFNLLGKGLPLGGINEHGLVIEELNFTPSEYSTRNRFSLNEFEWIQYHLDKCKNVEEVLVSCDTIDIVPLLSRLHYLVCDASGHVAVIEFIQGEIKIYQGNDLIVPVLTNNSYSNSLKYLGFHQGFGGNRSVSRGTESPERFVRAATLVMNYTISPKSSIIGKAFNILDSVKQDDTQWRIVYDILDKKIIFQTKQNPMRDTLDFNLISLKYPGQIMFINCDECGRNSHQFEKYTEKKNQLLIESVFEKLVDAEELSRSRADQLMLKLSR